MRATTPIFAAVTILRKIPRCLVLFSFLGVGNALLPDTAEGATATIDAAIVHQTIRGFGGATVFRPTEPLTTADLDTLFGNGPGQIGFTLLRIRVAEDDAWRATELANAQGAKARGVNVIATPWSPPAAMKNNGSLIDGFLNPASYAAYATYLNDFAIFMADNGAELYAISVQNEPDIDVDYESCVWTPAQMLDFCRNHAGAITATRLIAPESFQFRRNISDPILNDAIATENVEIIGGHIYGGGLTDYPLAHARGKEVWMTEHLELSTDWAGALATGREIHDCLAVANFSAYIWWYIKRYYGPLGEDDIITKRGHVMTQFTKFIRPGYVRIEALANPAPGVYVSAYRRDQLVIVAVNQGASAVPQTFAMTGAEVNTVTPWTTSSSLNMAPQAAIAVTGGTFNAVLPAGSVTTFVGDLVLPAPTIITPPPDRTVAAGDTLILDVTATGEFPSYQWHRDGEPLPGATARLLTIAGAAPSHAGNYTVTVANSGGSVTSSAGGHVVVAPATAPGRLVNISTRSPVGTGSGIQIGGFVLAGANPRQVLVRAAGPELNVSHGLAGVLADPMIELHDQLTGAIVQANDDWDDALAPVFASVQAFPWTVGSKDAALLVTLEPGAYTAQVRGTDGGTGVALVEVYEVTGGVADARLVNISTRSLVGLVDDVQIGGFVIGGTTARAVVIRAAGPALNASFGLNGVLADPVIELHDQVSGAVIATADNWEEGFADHFAAVGAFPWIAGSKDAALVTMLAPGAYTVIVRGRNAGTGLALVEIYEEP